MEIEIETSKQITEKRNVNVKLPYFIKSEPVGELTSSLFYYKIYSPTQALQVVTRQDMTIQQVSVNVAFNSAGIECTEDEFQDAYFNTQIQLGNIASCLYGLAPQPTVEEVQKGVSDIFSDKDMD